MNTNKPVKNKRKHDEEGDEEEENEEENEDYEAVDDGDDDDKENGAKRKKPLRRKCVRKACMQCRNSRKKCSDERPCRRCINLGIAHLCVDVEPKAKSQSRPTNKGTPMPGDVNATNKNAQSAFVPPPVEWVEFLCHEISRLRMENDNLRKQKEEIEMQKRHFMNEKQTLTMRLANYNLLPWNNAAGGASANTALLKNRRSTTALSSVGSSPSSSTSSSDDDDASPLTSNGTTGYPSLSINGNIFSTSSLLRGIPAEMNANIINRLHANSSSISINSNNNNNNNERRPEASSSSSSLVSVGGLGGLSTIAPNGGDVIFNLDAERLKSRKTSIFTDLFKHSTGMGIFISLATNLQLIDANDTYYELFGLSKADMMEKKWMAYVPKDALMDFLEKFVMSISNPMKKNLHYTFPYEKHGKFRRYLLSCTFIRDEKGIAQFTVGHVYDMTFST